MDSYVYLYFFLFLTCIYLVYYFNNKVKAKFPESYNLRNKNDLQFYPINYNSKLLLSSHFENKYWNTFVIELELYYLALQYLFAPVMEIIFFPKNILLKYING